MTLLALISTGKTKGTQGGAIRGLIGFGKEAVREGLVEGGGTKVVGSERINGETGPLVDSVLDALAVLQPPSDVPLSPDEWSAAGTELVGKMREVLGDFFAGRLLVDGVWARGVLGGMAADSWPMGCTLVLVRYRKSFSNTSKFLITQISLRRVS